MKASPPTSARNTSCWCQPPRSSLPQPGFGTALMHSLMPRSSGRNGLTVMGGVSSGVAAATGSATAGDAERTLPAAATGEAQTPTASVSARPATRRVRNARRGTPPVYHRWLGHRHPRPRTVSRARRRRPSDRAGRRLRRPVRAAHRTPGPRAQRVLRDRPPSPLGGRDGGQAAGCDHPVRRAEERPRRGRAAARPGDLRPRGADLRHLLRRAAHRPAARRHRRSRHARRVRPRAPHPHRHLVGAARRHPRCARRVDEPLRRGHRAAARVPCHGQHARRAGGRARERQPSHLGRAVPPGGGPLAARHGRAAHLPPRPRRLLAHLEDGVGHRRAGREDPRPGRRASAPSARCRVASTRRSRLRWCTVRSASSSRASTSTRG